MKKLVSILIPTRKRVKHLKHLLEKFNAHTKNYSCVEILIRLDNDDRETQNYFNISSDNKIYIAKCGKIDTKIIVGERLEGYKDVATFFNEMYRLSTGKWLWFFLDDAHIITDNWDLILCKIECNQIVLPQQEGNENWCDVPIIPKSFADYLGYATPGGPDGYWIKIGRKFNIIKKANKKNNLHIEYVHMERTGNVAGGETRDEVQNILKNDKQFINHDPRWWQESVVNEMADKIKELLNKEKIS